MRKIKVHLGNRSYFIFIGYNLFNDIGKLLPLPILRNPALIITNKKVNSIMGKRLIKSLRKFSDKIYVKEVPDSEQAKSFKIYNQIINTLTKIGKKTKPTIFALGGGVVGDISGFAASTYRRGIPYVQIPTTLLAQVDSSIGGKVAIDLPQAKNIVGSFYQPKAVICDISTLNSLPLSEIKNGLAEIIKYGIITDKSLFSYLENNLKKILSLDKESVEYVIWKCANIKAKVVEKDEYDTKDIRAILNFGHTFGHAIETAFKYSKQYTHGEAVAIGMMLASDMANKLKKINSKDVLRIKNIIKKAGLPMSVGQIDTERMLEALNYDKKFLHGKNRFVLPARIGRVEIIEVIPDTLIKTVLDDAA